MSQPKITPATVIGLLLIGCLLLVGAPLIALSFYNQPSLVDDYCFASTARNFGFWTAQQMYYNGWTGRYFHNFLVHSGPLVWEWYGGYAVFPILMLVLIWLSFYALIRELGRSVLSALEQVVIASGATFLYLSQLKSVAEFLYWYPGVASYTVSEVFTLFFITLLIRHDRQQFRLNSPLLLAESFLLICIIGSSETSMIIAMAILATLLLAQLLYRRKLPASLLVLLAVAAVSCYALIRAPGNAVRMSGNDYSRGFLPPILEALRYSWSYFPKQFLLTPLLVCSLLYLPIAYRLTDSRTPARRYFNLHPLLALAVYGGLLFVLTFLHFWAVGVQPVDRLLNMINLVLTVGWFYNLTIWVRVLRQRVGVWPIITSYSWPVVLIAGLVLTFQNFQSQNLRLTYNDLRSGRAQAYSQAMQQRYERMAQPAGDTIGLAVLPAAPRSLFLGDITDSTQHLWNRCWSGYYHIKGVRLQEPSVSAAAIQPTEK